MHVFVPLVARLKRQSIYHASEPGSFERFSLLNSLYMLFAGLRAISLLLQGLCRGQTRKRASASGEATGAGRKVIRVLSLLLYCVRIVCLFACLAVVPHEQKILPQALVSISNVLYAPFSDGGTIEKTKLEGGLLTG